MQFLSVLKFTRDLSAKSEPVLVDRKSVDLKAMNSCFHKLKNKRIKNEPPNQVLRPQVWERLISEILARLHVTYTLILDKEYSNNFINIFDGEYLKKVCKGFFLGFMHIMDHDCLLFNYIRLFCKTDRTMFLYDLDMRNIK